MRDPELRIAKSEVQVRSGRRTLVSAPLARFVSILAGTVGDERGAFLPRGVRFLERRRGASAVAIELFPQARTVRWIADDSPQPFGRRARYRECHLAFPYVELLLVLVQGHLTGQQQLYFRNAPLDGEADEALLLPNLYNVAEGYGQRCWVCLQNVRPGPTLTATVDRAVDHVFSAAFNKSSDVHEGNSYWEKMRALDPRVASVESWEQATRENRFFALEVPWQPAGTTLREELRAMLDRVAQPLPESPCAVDLTNLVSSAAHAERRST